MVGNGADLLLRQHRIIRQEQSARDFSSGQGMFSKEYFVYFEKKYRSPGGKDPLTAADELCGVAPKIKNRPEYSRDGAARADIQDALWKRRQS